jgi:hypothetical protein
MPGLDNNGASKGDSCVLMVRGTLKHFQIEGKAVYRLPGQRDGSKMGQTIASKPGFLSRRCFI